MSHPHGMHTEDARVASFDAVRPKGKKRTSNAKNKKNEFTWSLQSPSIQELAQAGFYYSPRETSPDNVTCFHCNSSLDQWEEGDNVFREHLANVPDCAFAIITNIEHKTSQIDGDHDPLSEHFLEARIATFGSSWPFEKEKGWVPKTKKLAEAGWHYSPLPESTDYTKCAYCGLCLDGWEPKDKPLDEHKRRSPECRFFELTARHKKTRTSKKSRASKASRTSVQSTTTTQDESALDLSAQPDDSILTTATDVTTASTASNGQKKGRAKKGAAKTTSRSNKAKKADEHSELETDAIASSKVEEDLPAQPQRTRGKKRSTTDMQADDIEEMAAPPPKKRATKTRGSTTASVAEESSVGIDDSVMEVESSELSMPKRGAKKRGAAGSRSTSRAASGTRKPSARKASVVSTASEAPLRRPVLDEGEIEAMLEADLERGTSDVEMHDELVEAEPEPEPRPKAKRQPQAKATKKTASKAAPRQVSLTVDEDNVEGSAISHAAVTRDRQMSYDSDANFVVHEDSMASAEKGLFTNHYDELDSRSIEDELATMGNHNTSIKREAESELVNTKVKAKSQGKKTLSKTTATNAKGKKTKTTKKVVEPSPELQDAEEPDLEVQSQPETAPVTLEQSELRFSSSFEHEPSILEEAEVPAALVEHSSPKKPITKQAAVAAKVTKSTKATKPVKKTQTTFQKAAKVEKALGKNVVEEQSKKRPDLDAEVVEEPAGPPSPSVHPIAQPAVLPRVESPVRQGPGGFPSPTPSPQSSNAENEPPSSRPTQKRPPLVPLTPSQAKTNTIRIPLADEAVTPTKSIKKDRADEVDPEWALKSSFPWRPIDLEMVFQGATDSKQGKWFRAAGMDKENQDLTKPGTKVAQMLLTSPEKKMTVEEWINFNAQKGEEKLRIECERLVGQFESNGVRALKALEGIDTQN